MIVYKICILSFNSLHCMQGNLVLISFNSISLQLHNIITQLLPVACDSAEYIEKEQIKKYV